jgi:hypothetical protein
MSGRFEWSLEPNELSRLLAEKRAAGAHILDLTESNPTRAGFDYPAEIAAALADPRALVYEPSPWGSPAAREAVAALHKVDVDRVMLTASTSESYSFLFKLLCGPGDNVLIPCPSYPLFEFLAKLECVEVRPYALSYESGCWRVDFDAMRAAVDARTRAVCVVHPNNPTGSYLKVGEVRELTEIVARHDLAILSDEVFACYPLADEEARLDTLAGISDVPVFCLNGLSKMAGLPQLKAGWMLMNAPAGLREKLELVADTFLSVAAPVQHALPRLLESGALVREQIRRRTRENLRWLRTVAQPLLVEGGWYAVVPVEGEEEEELVLRLLRDRNVLTQPGFFYDFPAGQYLVLSLLARPEEFRRGVQWIIQEAPAASRPSSHASP